ncbi:MAG: 8-oxoguanine deaminase [Alphaproteobacteria bacterium]|nr:MAG: 8-oxoguanine deaminase [Alphaproteobacteria bacterium]
MSVALAVERWLARPGRAPAVRDVTVLAGAGGVALAGGGAGNAAGRGLLAMPAPVNAHDHGMGIRTLDFGCLDDALEPWITWLRLRPPTDPYLEALVAFGRTALAGSAATMHCHNSHLADHLVEEAAAVVRAARDCGIRLGLSCPLLDDSPWVYGGPHQLSALFGEAEWQRLSGLVPRYQPISEQLAAIDAIARAYAGDGVDVQYGPIGPQWASDALLEAIAEASAATGRRIHMHLLESPRQRVWLDRRFPDGVVRHLDRIGFLSPRLAVAHGVHLRADECELLAERGVTVVTNPSANLRLRSGVAPLAAIRRAGLPFALGLDGTGFDDDQDIWREMRLLWLLHGGREMDARLDAGDLFEAAIGQGAVVVNQPAGGDVVVVDYAALTADAVFDDLDEARVLLARMNAAHVRDLVVAGRHVVRDGRLTGFDFAAARRELAAQARAALPHLSVERDHARLIADAVRRHYRERYPAAV